MEEFSNTCIFSNVLTFEYQMQLRNIVILMNCTHNVQVIAFLFCFFWRGVGGVFVFFLLLLCCFNDDDDDDDDDVFFFILHEQFLFMFTFNLFIPTIFYS